MITASSTARPRRGSPRTSSRCSPTCAAQCCEGGTGGPTMAAREVKVPDIGDFNDVPIIQVFVKPGDAVKAEDPLITLESDKATMDVPSPAAGTVKELQVKVGDRVSEGRVILVLEMEEAVAGRPAAPPVAAARPSAAPSAAAPEAAPAAAAGYRGQVDLQTGMLVI